MRALTAYLHEGAEQALELANLLSPHHRGQGPRPTPDEDPAAAQLRRDVRQICEAESVDHAAAGVNALLHRAAAAPVLGQDATGTWELHLHSLEADAHSRLTAKVASGMAVLIDDGRWEEIKQCAAERCEDFFRDTSRNRSRRYCSRTCANRVNAQRFRSRAQGSPEAQD